MINNNRNSITDFLKIRIGAGLMYNAVDSDGVEILTINRDNIIETLKSLRDTPEMNFKYFSWMTAIDYPDDVYRFVIVYELRNNDNFVNLRIKVPIAENNAWVPTVTGIYPSANWHEREMMELFGIEVKGHPDPRKLVLPDWISEHPLRKEFPHEGEELWEFHKRTIEMFNERNDLYQGKTDDPWLEMFNE